MLLTFLRTPLLPIAIFGFSRHKYTMSTVKESIIYEQQYNANFPIEDRISHQKLNSIKGYYLAVFDGHGGDMTSDYASKNFYTILQQKLRDNNDKSLNESQIIKSSLTEAFEAIESKLEKQMLDNINKNRKYMTVGSCALVAIITQNALYIANAGDCEGIIVDKSGKFKITNRRLNSGEKEQQDRLKKKFPNEPDLIVCSYGKYCYVKGRLQPTFSLGDFYLKKLQYNFTRLDKFTGPYVQHRPEITVFPIQKNDKYLLLATDGLWDEYSHKQVARIMSEAKEKSIANILMDKTLQAIGYRNNLSVGQLKKLQKRRQVHDDISFVIFDLQNASNL